MSVEETAGSGAGGGPAGPGPEAGPGTVTGADPVAGSGAGVADPPPGAAGRVRRTRRGKRPFWQELPILVVVALMLSLGIKVFFVQPFSIPSGSMQHTLEKGDRVLVDKFTPWFGATPERGEVVVFRDPGGWLDERAAPSGNSVVRGIKKALAVVGLMPSEDENDLIKRVIAVGGDTVECVTGSPVKVNGVPLDEPYLYPGATPCGDRPVGTVKVPKDRIWVMGDHRNDSRDSRYHVDEPGGGFVPVDNVIGRAFVVAWPLGHWDTLPVPDTFDRKALDRQSAGGGSEPMADLPAPEAAALAAAAPFALWRRRTAAAHGRRDATREP
ncbi:signal peptidase I [Kitasatospora sp. NPDC059327]|uniref:signal peptidase I n=1 Tax=Kitasatospora sp. NPDC059327 TaxID=3346803 RepID=UPI0036941F7B